MIETENGAKDDGKTQGTYITIEAADMDEEDEDYHREGIRTACAGDQTACAVKKEGRSVLIAGLGES